MASSSLMPRQSIILVYCTKNKSSGRHTRRYQAEFPGRKSKDECVHAARLQTHSKLLCKLPGGSILVGYSGLKVPFTRKNQTTITIHVSWQRWSVHLVLIKGAWPCLEGLMDKENCVSQLTYVYPCYRQEYLDFYLLILSTFHSCIRGEVLQIAA